MTRPLTRQEERAEAALWRAKEWRCHAYDESNIRPDLKPAWFELSLLWNQPHPALLDHLIKIGRVYP